MKVKIKIVLVIILCFFVIGCGNNKEDVNQFIIDKITSSEYIRCDYEKQKNGENVVFIYKDSNKTILKNSMYIYDLSNYNNSDLSCYKGNNDLCEYIEKDKGGIFVYTVSSYNSMIELKNVQERNGATCSTIQK